MKDIKVFVTTDKFIQINKAIHYDKRITKSYEVSVYSALVDCCYNNTNHAKVSIRTLAAMAKTTSDSVAKAIKVLNECGYITKIEKGEGFNAPNTYYLLTNETIRIPLDEKSVWYKSIVENGEYMGDETVEVEDIKGGKGRRVTNVIEESPVEEEPVEEVFEEEEETPAPAPVVKKPALRAKSSAKSSAKSVLKLKKQKETTADTPVEEKPAEKTVEETKASKDTPDLTDYIAVFRYYRSHIGNPYKDFPGKKGCDLTRAMRERIEQ